MDRADVNRAIFDAARRDRSSLFDSGRVRTATIDAGFDAIVAFSGVNVSYTGGVFTKGDETPEIVLTVAGGAQVLIAAEDYAMSFAQTSWISDIRSFRHGPDVERVALGLLADAVVDLGLSGGRLGLEGPVRTEVTEPLHARLPQASFGDARAVFDRIRRIKTPGEIELYRAAMESTQQSIQQAWAASRPGDTEKTIAARIQSAGLELGADWTSHCQMQAGVHSTVGMAASLENPVEPGDVIHVDYGGIFCGYRTDFARNAIVVAPSARQASIYSRLADIQHELIASVRPGMTGGEVWKVGAEEFARSGGLVHPWAMIGHGIGLEIHEGIELTRDCTDILMPGMLINIEPSHFEPGDARYHIEDTLLITETGNEILARAEVTSDAWVSRAMRSIG